MSAPTPGICGDCGGDTASLLEAVCDVCREPHRKLAAARRQAALRRRRAATRRAVASRALNALDRRYDGGQASA
jgi:hypothetical protein